MPKFHAETIEAAHRVRDGLESLMHYQTQLLDAARYDPTCPVEYIAVLVTERNRILTLASQMDRRFNIRENQQ